MRALLAALLAALFCACAAPGASAAALPPFEGPMTFPSIQDPSGPEEFTWEVQLREGQTLDLVDDRTAMVRREDGGVVFEIRAGAAHAADGVTVPTTIAVTQPNLLTLTVHHRSGNPGAGGAPFDYPVVSGNGWEGGIQRHVVQGPPPENPPAVVEEVACLVPGLFGRSLRAARRLLRKSNCQLGTVRGERFKGAKVTKQFRRPGKSLPAGTAVGVKLG
jgi:hypothetical protein